MTKAKEGDVDHKDPHACKDEKEIHDRCFFNWYQEDFLKGKNVPIPCDDVWQKYQNCINVNIIFKLFLLLENITEGIN